MRPAILAAFAFVLSVSAADTQRIDYDLQTNFAAIKTFSLMSGRVTSDKPEFDNRLFRQQIDMAIRGTLTSRGLKEVPTDADVRVEFRIAGQDYNLTKPGERIATSRGRAVAIPPKPQFVTEGTLIIDMTSRTGELVWRGTYTDQEPSPPSLAKKLPDDAKKLLAAYPPKR